ncbi:EAL domain-containing protein [Paraliobacillus sp. X-1268]|uniref:bifunctional diguanylate cyclase/phosphodiesterase n=1 Tax=Paraliobacillus sp. X-1268 TaxID=2213193 RepID=UPI000E3BA13E|nr:EAL domain-containing protein [Paraliobacillus sp. X-1268]
MYTQPDLNYFIVLNGEYDWPIVFLSVLMVCFASYVAISMNDRIQKNSFFDRRIWLLLASAAMGFGIWSMHFVGMGAYMLPVSMSYDHSLTLLSMIPAFGASFIAFYLVNQLDKSWSLYILSGFIMGLGITGMHYIGMESMVMDANFSYNPLFVFFSIAIAVIASFGALYIFSTSRKRKTRGSLIKAVTSIFLGLAVTSMHYTAMFGTTFYLNRNYLVTDGTTHQMNTPLLITGISIGVVSLLVLLMLSVFLDRYIDYRVSFFDTRTKLPNARLYEKAIRQTSSSKSLAVWQINNFEKMNMVYGYQSSDELIDYVVDTLKKVHIPQLTLYRLRDNQFAFLLNRSDHLERLKLAMKEVSQGWDNPVLISDNHIMIEGACAISTITHKDDIRDLYNHALSVLEHPTTGFQQEVVLYDSAVHTYSFDHKIMEGIDRAMVENQLFLVYQPKVWADTMSTLGFETLIRWQHPEYGLLSPAVFIPILERYKRMRDLTDWIIKKACRQLVDWQEEGHIEWSIAINIPGEYVSSSRLVGVLQHVIKETQLDAQKIELEITETSFVESIDTAMYSIETFRSLGFKVALDDFGTGVSSLSYLKQMPISTLKIDKTFIDHVPGSEKDAAIVKAIIDLGQSLNLTVVIEGIETKEQFLFLTKHRSDLLLQGYYFAKPMTVKEIETWIVKNHTLI